VVLALAKCKRILGAVAVDRTRALPRVSIIGEFWAMTTEGDGNYQLQRFLEGEGAEVDIQLVTAWLLYMVWEAQRDTTERMNLRASDNAKYGLGTLGPFDVAKKVAGVAAADKVVRALFQTFAHAGGLYGYELPDMFEIAKISHEYYNNDLRGGEGHMEVGKLIMNVLHSKAHMTLSVKPFGCMPSAGVSDGVQTAITEKVPGTIFCPVETSGDGRVNFYSRVQMYLFKAKQAAVAELERACSEHGVTMDQVRGVLASRRRFAGALHKAPHRYAGTAADLVAEVAPYIKRSRADQWRAWRARVHAAVRRSSEVARKSPGAAVRLVKSASEAAPVLAARLKEDVVLYRELRRAAAAS
jgi:predicted nucleotide-binding protein (sugar kinase/HSP70/actin superfamily)